MPNSQSNETYTQNQIRAFTQRGGPRPSIPIRYAGSDEQYLMMGDVSRPDRGSITPINVNDPRVRGQFQRTGVQIDAPDMPSNTVSFKQRRGGIPWYKFRLDCPINIYESVGFCADPSDPINGWESLSVNSRGVTTDKSYKGRTPFDGSDETIADVGFSWFGDVYDLGGLAIGEQAAAQVTTEVVDITYGGPVACADCGPPNDGTKWVYAAQQTAGGSSAVNSQVIYSTDYGRTWTALTITGIGVGVLIQAIDIVGQYLVVVAKSENAYYVSPINQLTGVPASTWTKITTGFVALKTPNDIYVQSPSRVYFVGDGGYIYLSTNILAGVSVLNAGNATTNTLLRITGDGRGNLLAVGASNTSLKSVNNGLTWAATTASVTGTLQAAAVLDKYMMYIGTAAGGVSYTEDGGETWTALSLPGSALSAVQDIVFPTAEAGWIAATRSGPTATILATTFGGAAWAEQNTSRLPSLPTFGRANRLAVPNSPDLAVAANNLAVAGLSGGLVDGVIYLGAAPVY